MSDKEIVVPLSLIRRRRRSLVRLPSSSSLCYGGYNSNNNNNKYYPTLFMVRLVVIVLVQLALSRCRSEAFAHSSSFFGTTTTTTRRNNRMAIILRGGSQSSSSSSSESSSTNGSIIQPITCVMQAPPPVYNNNNGRSMPDNTNNNGEWNKNQNNQKKQQKKMKLNHSNKLHHKKQQQQQAESLPPPTMSFEYVAETSLPTDLGEFRLKAYRMGDTEPCVIYSANHPLPNHDQQQQSHEDSSNPPPRGIPVRVHDQCMTSEVFGSQRCDCKEQLEMAMRYIAEHGGCIIYLQQEGRGIGLANKIAAYALQEEYGLDTVDANLHLGFPEDMRVYDVVPLILQHLRISTVRLLTNNPRKVQELQNLGINVVSTIPMVVPNSNQHNHKYLMTKRDRMDHGNLEQLAMSRRQPSANTLLPIMTPRRNYNNYMGRIAATSVGSPNANGTNGNSKELQSNNNTSNGQPPQQQQQQQQQQGVVKQSDGYCFGKQTVLDAIDAIRRGEMVVVVDDMDRENEGDFIMAADASTPEKMAEIIRYSSGVICVAMEKDRLEKLQLPSMVQNNQDPKGTAFAVSVDATKVHGIDTGISATDRSKTVQLLASDIVTAEDFSRPGHLFPLRAQPGGVLTRDGHTEATVDLARLAGRAPVGVLCEIVSEDHPTEMMRLPEMKRFAKERGYVLTSIADLIQYRKETGQ